MSKQPEDLLQRQQALDTTQSYIVQAPAGSGKTELISQRFLALLAKCEKPESVLAITFTRKAANEMRLRILAALQSASSPEPDEAHKKQTWQLARAAMQQDKQLGWNLLSNSARLRVVTIDSLNASLTRQMPLLSRMGTQASPTEQAEPLYQEAARRTLDQLEGSALNQDLSRLMRHLGNKVTRIQDLLVSMLARRDQWLRHLLPLQQQQDARSALESSLQQYVSDHLHRLKQQLPPGILQSLIDLAHFAANNLAPESNSTLRLWQDEDINTLGITTDELPNWQSLTELLLTNSNTPRKTVSLNEGFPPPSKEKDAERKQTLKQKKQDLLDLVNEIKQDDKLLQLIIGLRFMPATHYSDEQWQLVEALGRILLHSALELRVVFSEAGQVDFAEIALSANQALGDSDHPTELSLILDYRLQHILVDEFQDTSQGQMALLEKLTAGWQPNDGRTLFVVGDPMQSIYRFREAEVGLYLKAREQGIGDVSLQPLTLSVNFRSQQGIVDWVNEQLEPAFASETNIFTGAVTYSRSVAYHDLLPDDAVHVHGYAANRSGNKDAQEAEDIARLVQSYQQQQPDASIAILVRSRSHLSEVVEALKTHQLRFQAVELDPLKDQPCIIDLYTLTRALIHPGDRLHWLALLHAPWCGLNLPELEALSADLQQTAFDNCLNTDVTATLPTDAQLRLQKCLAVLEPVVRKPGRMTLRDSVAFVWHQLGGNAIYPGDNNHSAVTAYLDLLEKHEQSGFIPDLKTFDAALAKLHAQPDARASDRLQLMTIHKSKGLEFDIVILPGLGKGAKNDQPGLLEWLETPGEHGEGALMMAPIKASEEDDSDAISESLQFINKEKAQHERIRLLYVALTRARQRLHLFGHVNINAKGKRNVSSNSLLNILYKQLQPHFDAVEALEEDHTPEEHFTEDSLTGDSHSGNWQTFWRLPLDWQPETASPLPISQTNEMTEPQVPELEFDWASETARYIGILTHRYLEQFASASTRPAIQESVIRAALLNLGTHPDEVDTASQKVIQALNNTLSDERGQWILLPHQASQVEYGLTAKTAKGFQRFIIDRTFIDKDGARWIVDYKTGSHEGSDVDAFLDREQQRYQAQLNNYAQLFSQMENRPIKLGLYFPMLKGWREWDFKGNFNGNFNGVRLD